MKYAYTILVLFLMFSCFEKRSNIVSRPFWFIADSAKYVKVFSKSGDLTDSARITVSMQDSIRRNERIYMPFKIEFGDSTIHQSIGTEGLHIAGQGSKIFLGVSGQKEFLFGMISFEKFLDDTLVDFSSKSDKVYNLKKTLGTSWNAKWETENGDTVIVISNSISTRLRYKLFLKGTGIDRIVVPDFDPNAKYL